MTMPRVHVVASLLLLLVVGREVVGCELPKSSDNTTITQCNSTKIHGLEGCQCDDCNAPYRIVNRGGMFSKNQCWTLAHCTDMDYCGDCPGSDEFNYVCDGCVRSFPRTSYSQSPSLGAKRGTATARRTTGSA